MGSISVVPFAPRCIRDNVILQGIQRYRQRSRSGTLFEFILLRDSFRDFAGKIRFARQLRCRQGDLYRERSTWHLTLLSLGNPIGIVGFAVWCKFHCNGSRRILGNRNLASMAIFEIVRAVEFLIRPQIDLHRVVPNRGDVRRVEQATGGSDACWATHAAASVPGATQSPSPRGRPHDDAECVRRGARAGSAHAHQLGRLCCVSSQGRTCIRSLQRR